MKPLAIDLFCGLGGWADGLLAEGYYVIGFDIERHDYGDVYPAQLVLQDVLTLHGSQFKEAALIVASPPCQEYSYMAMPWTRAKQIASALHGKSEFPEGYSGSRTIAELTALFDACFRIQREASEAAGRKIPLVVENVKGAQWWVGRARWNFGSYYLWGDVPALMPIVMSRQVMKQGIAHRSNGETNFHGFKSQGMNWSDRSKHGQEFTRLAGQHATKNNGGSWFNIAHNKASGCGMNPDGRKFGGGWWHDCTNNLIPKASSKSPARKAASAMIAKIPLPLARHIARVWMPEQP